jgi:hypothetical protein
MMLRTRSTQHIASGMTDRSGDDMPRSADRPSLSTARRYVIGSASFFASFVESRGRSGVSANVDASFQTRRKRASMCEYRSMSPWLSVSDTH